MKIFEIYWRIQFLGADGGFTKSQYRAWDCLKTGGISGDISAQSIFAI